MAHPNSLLSISLAEILFYFQSDTIRCGVQGFAKY